MGFTHSIEDTKKAFKFLTGQEWYDRLEKELTDWFKEKYDGGHLKENILSVARRAAGIEGEG